MTTYDKILKSIEEEIEKTHDGTSMGGKFGDRLDKFIENKAGQLLRYTEVSTENGRRKLLGTSGISNKLPTKKQLEKIGETNMHMMNTDAGISSGESGSRLRHQPDWFKKPHYALGEKELNQLLLQNDDGDYLLKSTTLVSDDGWSMTCIKNDKFNNENHEDFKKLSKQFEKDVGNHEKAIAEVWHKHEQSWINKYIDENKIQSTHNVSLEKLRDEEKISFDEYMKADKDCSEYATKHTEDQMGSFETWINTSGYYTKFENVNCKLRTKQNSHLNIKDVNDLYEWENSGYVDISRP